MALRNENGQPLESEEEWLDFFTNVMKFPVKSSTQYSKYFSSECFTGDTLIQCIDDADIKSLLNMSTGHFLKFRCYIKPPQSTNNQTPMEKSGGHPVKIPFPVIKMESTQVQFEQFVFEWKKYKGHYNLSDNQAATTLFFSCSDEIRKHIRTKQNQFSSTESWLVQDLINLIKEITTSRTSPIVHIQGFLEMKQHQDEKC